MNLHQILNEIFSQQGNSVEEPSSVLGHLWWEAIKGRKKCLLLGTKLLQKEGLWRKGFFRDFLKSSSWTYCVFSCWGLFPLEEFGISLTMADGEMEPTRRHWLGQGPFRACTEGSLQRSETNAGEGRLNISYLMIFMRYGKKGFSFTISEPFDLEELRLLLKQSWPDKGVKSGMIPLFPIPY